MKRFVSFALAVCMVFTLAACSGSAGKQPAADSTTDKPSQAEATKAKEEPKKQTVLKMNLVISSTDKVFKYWEDFAGDITKASAGTAKVEVYPTETLGKTKDMIEAISKGAPILQDCDPSHLADYVSDFSVFMHPYLFKKPEDIEKLWKSDLGQKLSGELEKKGIKIVTLVYFGTRHLITNKPIITREDAKNLKIRCAPTKMWNEVAKTLGGNPTNTAWSEVYTALSQGVADAAESPLNVLYSAKLHETRKNISLTGHLVATTAIVMSKAVYDSLPPEGQKAIDDVGKAYPPKRAEQIAQIEQEFRKKMEDEGVKFNDVDKTSFIEAAKDVSKSFPEWTPGLYDQVLKVISE